MDIESIRDLLAHEIWELYDAEGQILGRLPAVTELVSDIPLEQALREHTQRTYDHRLRLETVARDLGIELQGGVESGVGGIFDRIASAANAAAPGAVRDAVIIASVQKVEHSEIAAYGAALSYARILGEDAAAELLDRTLEEEKEVDRRLTGIAENFVHRDALEGADTEERAAS